MLGLFVFTLAERRLATSRREMLKDYCIVPRHSGQDQMKILLFYHITHTPSVSPFPLAPASLGVQSHTGPFKSYSQVYYFWYGGCLTPNRTCQIVCCFMLSGTVNLRVALGRGGAPPYSEGARKQSVRVSQQR